MNRTIKFRAWDKKNKAMMLVCDSLKNLWFDVVGATGVHDGPSTFISEPEDIELMQFTGLHDKNGKEIYEGDIVKFKEPIAIGGKKINWVIEYNPPYFEPFNKILAHAENCEIIGNIYKNPELLEKK